MPLIRHLEISRYKSTGQANEQLTLLSESSGWPDHVLSRLAIARSLQIPKAPDSVKAEGKGKELRGETFFRSRQDADFLPWVVAMIAQHLGRSFKKDDEALELVVAHWHRGLQLLRDDLETHGGDFNDMILALARAAGDRLGDIATHDRHLATRDGVSGAPSPGTIEAISVPVGRMKLDEDPVRVTLNDSRRYSNCHVAVSGMSGSGKTQLVKQMLASAAQKCDETTGMIFLDYAKGDVADDASFVQAINADVVRLPGDVLPIGPFHLPDYAEDAIRLAAEEKREVYTQLFRNLGPKQEGRLVEAIRRSYRTLAGEPVPAPDFNVVRGILNDIYEDEGLQPDSLTELFRRLNAYELFWSRDAGLPPVSPIHTKRWVVDIHELGGLKEVTAFTVIEQLYREMRALPEATIDSQSGLRHIRCFVIIDEAQYYLRAKNRFLQGIIREGRSKGFAVMLMCQSPDDFDQQDFDYTEQLQFTYMLQCKTEPKAVQRLLGVSRHEAKQLATDLGRMDPLHGLGQLAGDGSSRLAQFRIVPFFEALTS